MPVRARAVLCVQLTFDQRWTAGPARAVEGAEPDVVCSDCPLAGLQLTQKTGRPSFHPVRVLHRALRGDNLRSPRNDGETS